MYSFDVYDTLITRTVVEPSGIFRLLSASGKTPEGFFDVRIESERKARQKNEKEICIEDIYTEIASFYGLNDKQRDELMNMEIRFEEANTIPVISNINRIEKLIADGERVVLISDMYLSSEIYKRFFAKTAPVLLSLPLYISCECNAVKTDGSLYEYVSDSEGMSYSDWTHIGDNNISDVIVPEMLGIRVERFFLPSKLMWEEKMQQAVHDQAVAQIVVGLSRNTRMLNHKLPFSVGYSFAGPILYAYVSWIIKRASQEGIKRLFFLARDGYVLKEVADEIIKEDKLPLSTYYLYSSRAAWVVEGDKEKKLLKRYLQQEIPEIEKNDFAFVDAKGTGKTLDKVAKLMKQRFVVFFYQLLEPVGEKWINAYSFSSFGGLIEAVCRAPHGITLSYEERNGKVCPVLGGDGNGEMNDYLMAIKSFARDYHCVCQKNEMNISMFSISEWLMKYAVQRPDRELASYIGEIVHNEKNNGQKYAPEITAEKIRQVEYERTTEPINDYYEGYNLEYSYYRLDEEKRSYVDKCRKEYYLKKINNKIPSAVRVMIYGFGVCGREAYHRLRCSDDFIIEGIVDQNYERIHGDIPKVEHPAIIKEKQVDYVLIALIEKKQVDKIKGLLFRTGIKEDRLIGWAEFEEKFLGK